jgi:hypothetical protein
VKTLTSAAADNTENTDISDSSKRGHQWQLEILTSAAAKNTDISGS